MGSGRVGRRRLLAPAEPAGDEVEYNHLEEDGAKHWPAEAPAAACLLSLRGPSLSYHTTAIVIGSHDRLIRSDVSETLYMHVNSSPPTNFSACASGSPRGIT